MKQDIGFFAAHRKGKISESDTLPFQRGPERIFRRGQWSLSLARRRLSGSGTLAA